MGVAHKGFPTTSGASRRRHAKYCAKQVRRLRATRCSWLTSSTSVDHRGLERERACLCCGRADDEHTQVARRNLPHEKRAIERPHEPTRRAVYLRHFGAFEHAPGKPRRDEGGCEPCRTWASSRSPVYKTSAEPPTCTSADTRTLFPPASTMHDLDD
jgi:hypothetical protein